MFQIHVLKVMYILMCIYESVDICTTLCSAKSFQQLIVLPVLFYSGFTVEFQISLETHPATSLVEVDVIIPMRLLA